MLLHMCRCGKLIPQEIKLCDACQERAGQRYIDYNEHRRDDKTAAFYVSKQWRMMRAQVLAAYDYIDVYAYYVMKEIRRADTVHHIAELSDDWERRLDPRNLIPLASATHNTIHTLYERDRATKIETQAALWGIVAGGAERVGVTKLFWGG